MQVRRDGAVDVVDCDSVEEFFTAIYPAGSVVQDLHQPIYRGQANASWGLVPLVLRSGWREKNISEAVYKRNYEYQIHLEIDLVRDYLNACDVAGLSVQGDSPDFRELCFSYEALNGYFDGSSWPPKRIHNLLASAQHHGVATRLLDWTSTPYVAAYFAAADAIESTKMKDNPEQRLAVWVADEDSAKLAGNIEVIRVAGAVSTHLVAQSGLFMMPIFDRNNYRVDLAVDDLAVDIDALFLKKITLPIKYAIRVLQQCERFGVSAARLFPTFDGAGKQVAQNRLIEKIR